MSPPPTPLAYEIPLTPGELRVHETDGAITLVWLPADRTNRADLLAMGLWTVVLASLLAFFAYHSRSVLRGGLDLCSVAILAFTTIALLVNFVRRLRGGQNALRTITADRDGIVFSLDRYNGFAIPGVSHFSAELVRGNHYALMVHPRPPPDRVRRRRKRLIKPSPPNALQVLTHPDGDLLRTTATRLNALLTASSPPPPATRPLPSPPPSPAPPTR